MAQGSGQSVIIIGGGIAGLSAALAFRHAGWAVSVYEQAPRLTAMGAAISLWPNALTALDRLGCGPAVRHAAQPLDHLELAERSGRTIGGFHVSRVMSGPKGVIITRTALQTALVDMLGETPLHLDHRLEAWEDTGAAVRVRFSNGAEAQADLLVAADGIWSDIARSITGVSAAHAGYGGVLALSDPGTAPQAEERGVEYWAHHERMGVFALPGGARYWFYMKNEAGPEESAALTLDAVAKRMESGWPPDARAAVASTDPARIIAFSVHAKPPPRLLGRGRIILAGDAAHPMEPNLGQGACQAIEDAVALGAAAKPGQALAILPRYTRMRLKRVRQFVQLSQQGSLPAHRLPRALLPLALWSARHILMPLSPMRIRTLYTLPDYGSLT